VPVLGRSATTDWAVEGGHMAERCGLFVIIALGESVLVTGATFAGPRLDRGTHRRVPGGVHRQRRHVGDLFQHRRRTRQPSDRVVQGSRTAGAQRLHLSPHPAGAGIIVAAVGDDLALHHPNGHNDIGTAAVLIGGPALYLFGNLLFKRLSAPTCRSRIWWDLDCSRY
jgi:low temperature requirement protein LtrA